MAERKQDIGIPRQSILYIGVCLSGILIFVLLGIVPASHSLKELDAQIAEAGYRFEGQKTLLPLYQSLQGRSEKKKESQVLPLPEQGKLPQDRIHTLPTSFGNAAKTSGLTLVSALPNLNALTGDAQFLSMDVVLRGNFLRFRNFLVQIGSLPHVHHIEEISIQGKAEAMEFRVKVWVAVG
jgi:hypothetical protein